jgi:hypothetical protein
MTSPRYLPIPPELLSLACETISRRVVPLPFTEKGVTITPEKVGVCLESLNAEVTRTLPVRTTAAMMKNHIGGFDRVLTLRLGESAGDAAPVIADVLIRAGIAEITEIQDRSTHACMKGIRLLPAWTWHIVSETPVPLPSPATTADSEPPASWLAKCPVCRTGILCTVTEKQLFGMPAMEYYFECTHCGAKFVPEKDDFRLVSIAKIRDPRWRRYLSTSRSADAWETLARGDLIFSRKPAPARHTVQKPAGEVNTGQFTKMKDGSVAIPYAGKTLFFRRVILQFTRSIQVDLFCRSTRPLAAILALPEYAQLKPNIERQYSRYLPMTVGSFLAEQKLKNNPVVREFLHTHGGAEFCSFRMPDDECARQKGVIILMVNGAVEYVGACHSDFGTLIDNELGRIVPDMCYRDGNETACRVNAAICAHRQSYGLFVHAMTDDESIDALAADVISRYSKTSLPHES